MNRFIPFYPYPNERQSKAQETFYERNNYSREAFTRLSRQCPKRVWHEYIWDLYRDSVGGVCAWKLPANHPAILNSQLTRAGVPILCQ